MIKESEIDSYTIHIYYFKSKRRKQ